MGAGRYLCEGLRKVQGGLASHCGENRLGSLLQYNACHQSTGHHSLILVFRAASGCQSSATCLVQDLLDKLRSHGPNVCAICCARVSHDCGLQVVNLFRNEDLMHYTGTAKGLLSYRQDTAFTHVGVGIHSPNLTTRWAHRVGVQQDYPVLHCPAHKYVLIRNGTSRGTYAAVAV